MNQKSGNIWEEFYLDCLCEENLTLVKKVARRGQQVGKIAGQSFLQGAIKWDKSVNINPQKWEKISLFLNAEFNFLYCSFC